MRAEDRLIAGNDGQTLIKKFFGFEWVGFHHYIAFAWCIFLVFGSAQFNLFDKLMIFILSDEIDDGDDFH